MCGAFPITVFDGVVQKSTLPDEAKNFLSKIWADYGRYSANYLVDETHKKGSPWQETYVQSSNKVIPNELMLKYFKSKDF